MEPGPLDAEPLHHPGQVSPGFAEELDQVGALQLPFQLLEVAAGQLPYFILEEARCFS